MYRLWSSCHAGQEQTDEDAQARAGRSRQPIPDTSLYESESEDAEPPLKVQMCEFVKVHVCGDCEGTLAVRRQRDDSVRVRCRECGKYERTNTIREWFAEDYC